MNYSTRKKQFWTLTFQNNPFSIAYQCCTYLPLRASTDKGIATVSSGQIVAGGEVTENNLQYAFDYISNIKKKLDEQGEIFYEVNIRRFSCLDLQKADRSVGK